MQVKNAIIALANNKEFGKKFRTTDYFWNKVDEILKVLKPLYITTKEMQKVGYGLADFYVSWLRIEKKLDRICVEGTLLNLAPELKKALEEYQQQLLDTPTMVAAIFLDPRIKFKLTNIQKECATLYLKKLFVRMHGFKYSEIELNETGNNTLDELNEDFAIIHGETETNALDTSNLLISLADYETVKHFNLKHSTMDFWKHNKEQYPLIYPLACAIHAVPAGQAFEERNFSSFGYIRNAKRTMMKPKNLQNVLVVRLNKEIFYEHKEKRVNEIKNK